MGGGFHMRNHYRRTPFDIQKRIRDTYARLLNHSYYEQESSHGDFHIRGFRRLFGNVRERPRIRRIFAGNRFEGIRLYRNVLGRKGGDEVDAGYRERRRILQVFQGRSVEYEFEPNVSGRRVH